MSDPIPPVENVDDAVAVARETIKALKRAPKGETVAQARARSCKLVEAQQRLIAASRKTVTDAVTPKRPANSNGHAPATGGTGAKPAGGLSGFTEKQVSTIVKIMATCLRPHFDAYDKRFAALEQKRGLAPLAARLTQIEMNSLKYEGTWSETKAYSGGAFVTFQGGLWYAEDGNVGVRPGAGSSSWKLAVKRGRGG